MQPKPEQIVGIPLVELTISTGRAASVDSDHQPTTSVLFDKTLCDGIGVDIKHLRLLRIDGDSMAPDIVNGAYIMFDRTAATRPFRDGLWIFRLGDAVQVKRIQQVGPHQYEAHSINPNYRPFTFDDDFQFIGRVVWSDRRW